MVESINAGDIDATVDELFAPRAARRVKRLFAEFYAAFPDWREEIIELVAEGNTVAGRFRCSVNTAALRFRHRLPRASVWRLMRCSFSEWTMVSSRTSGHWRTA